METYWVPGVNHRGGWGRWAFVELTEIWQLESGFAAKVEQVCEQALRSATAGVA